MSGTIHFTVFGLDGLAVRGGQVPDATQIDIQAVYPGEIALLGHWPEGTARLQDWEIVPQASVSQPVSSAQVKAHAARLLSYSDWAVTRFIETRKPVSKALSAERAAIRSASNRLEAMNPIPPDFEDEKWWRQE